MENAPQTEKKKTKSDIISQATVGEYVLAHAKPNGGLRSFLHSNLFAALIVWGLSQAVIFGGFIVTYYFRTVQLSEWKGQTDATLHRMDDQGTLRAHYEMEQMTKQAAKNESRIDRLEENTRHIEVLESEHRRLTRDVEELRNGKK